MAFKILESYPRRAHLDFYRGNPSPFYAVTFDLDATRVRTRARGLGVSTYAALCWTFHRAMLGIDAFRTRLEGEHVVLHDRLRIGMTVPAPGRTFTFATFEWDEAGERFLHNAADVMARASSAVDLSGGAAPDFAYYTSAPRVPFTGITHVRHQDPWAGQPMTAFGKFRETDGRVLVPVGMQVNHMYVDGADMGDLYEAAEVTFQQAF